MVQESLGSSPSRPTSESQFHQEVGILFLYKVVYERGKDINVVGIHSNFEGPEYRISQLQELKEELFIRFPYCNDTGFAATFYEYKVSGTPHWILIDKNGIVKDSISDQIQIEHY